MDFELDDDQRDLVAAVSTLLDRRAGPARAREISARGGHDADLVEVLEEGGYLDVLRHDDGGPLAAVMLVEAAARAVAVAPLGPRVLVVPALTATVPPGPVAVALEGDDAPVRFGAEARTLLVVGEREARLRELRSDEAEPVSSRYGYPLARVPTDGGEPLGEGSAEAARRWWRLSIAAETVGTMSAAFELTTGYVRERRQFGRPIGSFQAIQHRLAEAAVGVEGSRWLCYEAAWHHAPVEGAAVAAASATETAKRLGPELHQLTGAIGFTTEYDLQLWTMRLQVLRLELDGSAGHARAVTAARWARPA